MPDFRQIPKTAVLPVVDGELEREKEWRRRTHHIREGDRVKIRTLYGFTDTAMIYDVSAVVESVEQYFVRLRYPAGFIVSFLWKNFEFMRLRE